MIDAKEAQCLARDCDKKVTGRMLMRDVYYQIRLAAEQGCYSMRIPFETIPLDRMGKKQAMDFIGLLGVDLKLKGFDVLMAFSGPPSDKDRKAVGVEVTWHDSDR